MVRKRLVDLLRDIPYDEVVQVEQELISESLPAEEVLKFCDIHTVNRLRIEVGQDTLHDVAENSEYVVAEAPGWFNPGAVTVQFDASPILNAGGSPMAEILSMTNKLQPGEVLELKTPFVPAPIIDMLKGKGFQTFSLQRGGEVVTYFAKA